MAETSNIELDASAMREYARFLTQAPEIAHEEMAAGVEEALQLLEREVKENTPVGVHSLLRGSIAHRLRGEGVEIGAGAVGEVFSPLNYAAAVELGTKPHFPPLAPLRDWVQRKLGVDASRSESVAFLVARKIAKRGTKAAKMFATALNDNASQVNSILAARVRRIADRLTGER